MNENKETEKSSISRYFSQDAASEFDQILGGTSENTSIPVVSSSIIDPNNEIRVSENKETLSDSSQETHLTGLPTMNLDNNLQEGALNTPSAEQKDNQNEQNTTKFTFETTSANLLSNDEKPLIAQQTQLGSPQPAVLTPGVTQPNSQASTPFKEIDPTQAAFLESSIPLPNSKEPLAASTPAKNNQKSKPTPNKGTETSPNTSVDVESTIVKFSQTSITDSTPSSLTTQQTIEGYPPSAIIAQQQPITYSPPVPPRSLTSSASASHYFRFVKSF